MSEKVAVVTGAGMGIGASIAARLARDGCAVVVSDISSEAAGKTADELATHGFDAWPLVMDVSKPDSIAAGFAAIAKRYSRCDVLVNNAGIAKTIPFVDYPLDHWSLVMAVNVTGPMLCGQQAVRLMRPRKWGRIVNIASISGMRASTGRTAYGTSKAALIGLTRQMAIELAEYGITANGVAPGPVETPLTREMHSEATRHSYMRAVPMARYGTADEIAAAVSFLASEDASYITGHIVPVDGGFMAAGLLEI
jgi:3-oxoacyl-[acyl-carrier protein] reductase